MQATVYNKKGEKAGNIDLPEELFAAEWNADLVHQVVVSVQSNARTPVAHAKGRSEVSGTGRKPWRQKGSGRARHGSRRSPIWVGGGVTHGPSNEKNFSKKINRKMKARALASLLSRKLADGEVIFVDDLESEEPKTAEAKKTLEALSEAVGAQELKGWRGNAACLALPISEEQDRSMTKKSFRNLGHLSLTSVQALNPVRILDHRYLIIERPQQSLEFLTARIK